MLSFTGQMLVIIQNLGLTEEQMKVPMNITTAIQDYIDGHINETTER